MEFWLREILHQEREGGVLAWDVAAMGITYMCAEAVAYLALVSTYMQPVNGCIISSTQYNAGHMWYWLP